jgi:sulfonate transport system substrate-binding protein
MRKLSRMIPMLSLSCCLALAGCSKPGEEARSRNEAALAKDRLYAGYRLDQEGAIDIGVQPLSMPANSVSELLSRDNTLAFQLKAKNLVLKPFPFYKGEDIYPLLANGKLEAAYLGDMPAITAAATGDIVIFAMVKQGFSSIVAGKPMLVSELKGKRVATGLGSTAHFTLLTALENEGLTERDVELVGMEVSDMPKALAQGKIDAFSAWEPTPIIALAAHPEFYLVHKGLSFGFLCFRREFFAARPVQARQIAAAVARGCLWMRQPGRIDQTAHWIRASAANFQGTPYFLQTEQTTAVIRNDLLSIPIAPQIPARLLRENELLWKEFNFLKRHGKIPRNIPWNKVRESFDTELLQGVLSDATPYAVRQFHYRGDNEQDGVK